MGRRIEKDHTRFRQIVRGLIRKNLKKYVTQGEMIGRQGKHAVSIPLPQVQLPRFRFGKNQGQGVGQGEGAEGSPIEPGEGTGQAGDAPGQHILEVDVDLAELARILGEELELPNIKPKGQRTSAARKGSYTGIAQAGPESLRHFKRTFKQALKRSIATGLYDPERPVVVPIREDRRYRSWKLKAAPQASAAILYMMDVSGSMGKEQKELVRIEAFWIDTWLRHQYRNLEVRYIIHDAEAHLVDEHTFFHVRESGGTKISSAYELCNRLIRAQFPPDEWNLYPFHFSDGDNWSSRDTDRCVEILREELLPAVNVFCYGQVRSAYGSGQFKKDLDRAFPGEELLITSEIPDREGILPSIKDFLGKGR